MLLLFLHFYLRGYNNYIKRIRKGEYKWIKE